MTGKQKSATPCSGNWQHIIFFRNYALDEIFLDIFLVNIKMPHSCLSDHVQRSDHVSSRFSLEHTAVRQKAWTKVVYNW